MMLGSSLPWLPSEVGPQLLWFFRFSWDSYDLLRARARQDIHENNVRVNLRRVSVELTPSLGVFISHFHGYPFVLGL